MFARKGSSTRMQLLKRHNFGAYEQNSTTYLKNAQTFPQHYEPKESILSLMLGRFIDQLR